jgi:DNA polymerase III alpha subunit
MMLSIPTIIKAASTVGREKVTLFGTGEELLPEITHHAEFPLDRLLNYEKEYLGFYISSNPLDAYRLPEHQEIASITEGSFSVVGLVSEVKTGVKNNRQWTMATVEDYTGMLKVLIFERDIIQGQVYKFKGRVQYEDDKYVLFAHSAEILIRKAA